MNSKDVMTYILAGIGGVFLGYWLLNAADALIFKLLEPGDLATWFAASGTILTLGFLIKQHTQIRQEQKKEKSERKAEERRQREEILLERKHREEHERKQQEMWAGQNEHLSFEKFQTHKTMFNNMLKELEKKFEAEFTFFDIDGLYENLFPNNGFFLCQTKIDLNSELESCYGSLKDALDGYTFINKDLDNCDKVKDFYRYSHDYLSKLMMLSSLLHIDFKSNSNYGGIYVDIEDQEPRFLLNVFSPLRTAIIIENVLKRICSFTGNQGVIASLSHKETSFFFNIIQRFAFEGINLRGYQFDTHDMGSYLYLLYDIKNVLEAYRTIKEIDVNGRYIYFSSLFSSETKMNKYFNRPRHSVKLSIENEVFFLKDLRENFVTDGESSQRLLKLEKRASALAKE